MRLARAMETVMHRYLLARGVTSHPVNLGGERVHYYALEGSGRGPPVLLIHGLAGSAGGFSRLLFPLAQRFSRVVAVDLPGCGLSPMPAVPMGLLNQSRLLGALCEQALGEPAYVLGNSMGGALALSLAHLSPKHVRALGLISPAGAWLSKETYQALIRSLDVRTNADARRFIRRIFHRPPWAALAMASEFRAALTRPAVREVLREMREHESWGHPPEALASITMPALLIWGESDRLLPKESLDYFRAHLPAHARIRLEPGCGHVAHLEAPTALLEHFIHFADDVGL